MTKAFESAVRLLARREHGAIELADKLKQKGFGSAEIKETLKRCQELDLQNEERFVEMYSRTRINQGYGPLKITQDLSSKGVDKELIKCVLQQEEDNWLSYALDVWRKKNNGRSDLSFSEMQKQQRFLLYRGFGMDIISAIFKLTKNGIT